MATGWFYRDGSEVEPGDVGKIRPTRRADTGCIVRRRPCSRCGGPGGSEAWKFTGYTCYRCGGHNSMTFESRDSRVYTADRLASLNDAAERKAAKKRAEAERKVAKRRAEFISWAREGGRERGAAIGAILCAARNQQDGFIYDLARKIRVHWTLSERQLSAAAESLEQVRARETRDAESGHVGAVKERIEFSGVVEFETEREGYYGTTHVIKFRDDSGNVLTWFASGLQDVARGDMVRVVGTVKKHDEYRGVRQTVLTRCRYSRQEAT